MVEWVLVVDGFECEQQQQQQEQHSEWQLPPGSPTSSVASLPQPRSFAHWDSSEQLQHTPPSMRFPGPGALVLSADDTVAECGCEL